MDISKIGVGVIITVVVQTAGIVWWVAQQAATVENLKVEVAEVTDKVQLERQINLERDVRDIQKTIESLQKRLDTHWDEIQASATLKQIDELQAQINDILNILNNIR